MAQKTRSSSSRTKRNSSSGARSRTRNSTKSRNGTPQTSKTVVAELAAKAKPQAEKVKRTGKRTGERVSGVAAKAKTPLIAGGAALAGLAGGVALKSRTENRRPVSKLRSRSLPKVDLDKIIEVGRQVRALGEQVGDVADTAEKTRKKHK